MDKGIFKFLHLVYVPFSGVGLHGGYRGDKWFKFRIEIFKKYCLASLLNQTNKNFTLWLSFRPDEASNPETGKLFDYLIKKDIKFIFTFQGLMYHDDKFTDYKLKHILKNFGMMLWDCYKYGEVKNPLKMIRYSVSNKNNTLEERLRISLAEIEDLYRDDRTWVYVTRIDSDDMFRKETIDLIQKEKPALRRALVILKGYAYNLTTGQFADWKSPNDANPPYHTIMFPSKIFFNPKKHLEYYKNFRTHEDIPKVFKAKYLPDNLYCFTIHGKNISTSWTSFLMKIQNNHIYNEYFGKERKKILSDFGIKT